MIEVLWETKKDGCNYKFKLMLSKNLFSDEKIDDKKRILLLKKHIDEQMKVFSLWTEKPFKEFQIH